MHAARSCSQARRKVASRRGQRLGEGQTPEDVPDAALRSQPSVLSPAERLQRIRKRPRRHKEDMLHEVMQQSRHENRKAQEWRESERRFHQQNAEHWHESAERQHQSTEQLISTVERQKLLSQNSFPCAAISPPTHFPQHPGSYHHQLPPTPVALPPSPANCDPYPQHSTPITMHFSQPEVQHSLHSTPDRKAEYENRTYTNL
nr:uncharacterized protein LOC125642059 [Caretta caretta]